MIYAKFEPEFQLNRIPNFIDFDTRKEYKPPEYYLW